MTANNAREPREILLVDDDPSDVRLTIEAMKEGGLKGNLSVVHDGEEALKFLRREEPYTGAPRPHLILLDLNLPKRDGREVLAEIKATDSLKCIPVVILTTSTADEDIDRTYKLQANCYVAKPLDLDEFIYVIKQIKEFWFRVVRLPTGTSRGAERAASDESPSGDTNASLGRGMAPRLRMAGNNHGRVLVTDDNPATRDLLRLQLEEQSFEVLTAGSGEECIRKAKRDFPEVILLDINMPELDGIETCRRLKRSKETAAVPILFVTGHRNDEATTLEALAAGGNDFISKDMSIPVLAARVSNQISAYRAYQQLRGMAMTDELTGIASRRFLFESLRRCVKVQSRRGPPGMACLMVDIDHFKRINDTHGHLKGDRVLRQVAASIDATTRDSDLVARFGGEEFVVVMPDADLDAAKVGAEKVRSAVERRCVGTTVSVGVAWIPAPAAGDVETREGLDAVIQQLLRHADRAMYTAKELGRNRIAVSEFRGATRAASDESPDEAGASKIIRSGRRV